MNAHGANSKGAGSNVRSFQDLDSEEAPVHRDKFLAKLPVSVIRCVGVGVSVGVGLWVGACRFADGCTFVSIHSLYCASRFAGGCVLGSIHLQDHCV